MDFPLFVLSLALGLTTHSVNGVCQRQVCYYTNWSQYRPTPETRYTPDDIDANLCTHIMYSFAKLVGNKLAATQLNDESTNSSVGNYEKVINQKRNNPDLKVLLVVGDWNMGSAPFHAVVKTAASRSEFVSSTVQFLRSHKFDGLDLQWKYPGIRGSPADDKHKFSLLVSELRQAFNNNSRDSNRLLLTAAVAAWKDTIDAAYEVSDIVKNLDFINLMSYDFHGEWETVTGHNSPLYGRNTYSSVDFAAKYWVQLGAPKNKIVIGLPLFGRSFTLSGKANGVGAPASIGNTGNYTRMSAELAYYEVCELLKAGGSEYIISDQHVPYLISGNQWVGYDNQASLREKVRYIKDQGYGGALVWTLDLDDVKGHFCGAGPYPMLSVIYNECFK